MWHIGGTKVVWLGSTGERGVVKDDAGYVGRDVLHPQSFVGWILKAFGCQFRILSTVVT